MSGDKLPEPTVYRNWILSILPPKPDRLPIDLASDCKELLLMEIFEILRPGTLDWKKIDLKPGNFYKKLSNLTILWEAMREQSIVVLSIRPADILEGKIGSLYAVLWNFMRIYFIDHVSQTQEVDDGAIVEWATNFRSPDIQSQPCPRDEIISGDDKDFFYGTLINENLGNELANRPENDTRSQLAVCAFQPIEQMEKVVEKLPISIKTGERPITVEKLEKIVKKEIIHPRNDLLDDFDEIVDMNFLSPDPAPKPVPVESARQSLLKISNLFGNIPLKIKEESISNKQVEKILESKIQAGNHSQLQSEKDQKKTPNQIFKDKLMSAKILKPSVLEKWKKKDEFQQEISSFLDKKSTVAEPKEEENSEFDIHSMLMEVHSDLGGQAIIDSCSKTSKTQPSEIYRNQIIQNISKINSSGEYPPDFKFGKDFQKIFYKTLKNEFSSKTSIREIRGKSIELFFEKIFLSKSDKNSVPQPQK